MVRFSLFLVFIGGQFGCGGCETELAGGDPTRPDIVLISVDTLRADHLSSYGYDRPTSPFFDSLATEGVRFGFAHSASPWTLPAHTTMLTGQLPMTHRIVEDTLMLPTDTPVLPELLQAEGYATGGFVATYYVSKLFGFDRGFDRFDDFGLTEQTNLRGEVIAEDVVDEALDFYGDQEAGQSVFLFVHLYDVHYGYDPPAPYDTTFDRAPTEDDARYINYFHFLDNLPSDEQMAHQVAQYDESILYVNDQLRRIREAAVAAGREVLFVITADHGEEFGERGSWGHAHTLYAEQLHVPLIFSGPGVPNGTVSEAAVGTHDIAPTIAAWAGLADGALEADGVNLLPIMEAPETGISDRVLTAETTRFESNRLSVYSDGLRLEWDLKWYLANDRSPRTAPELFDPHADPDEQTDISADRPEDVARLARLLLEELGTPWTAQESGRVHADHVRMRRGRRVTVPGIVLVDGEDGVVSERRLRVEAGQSFMVLPYDAEVFFTPQGGSEQGPWQIEGGTRPETGDPLSLDIAGSGAGQSSLDESQQDALEALGYIQD